MANITLTLDQVKEARRLAWLGENISKIARALKEDSRTVRRAVRGETWSSIHNPPPVPYDYKPVVYRVCTNPLCGDVYQGQPHNGYCLACYSYMRRNNGKRRNAQVVGPGWKNRIEVPNIDELYERYRDGEAVEQLAEDLPVSAETLRRKFRKHGYKLRKQYELHQAVTPEWVEQARYRVHHGGESIVKVAADDGVNYQTAVAAISGVTWRKAGGPLPQKQKEELSPCQRCGVLCQQELCRYCRQELTHAV